MLSSRHTTSAVPGLVPEGEPILEHLLATAELSELDAPSREALGEAVSVALAGLRSAANVQQSRASVRERFHLPSDSSDSTVATVHRHCKEIVSSLGNILEDLVLRLGDRTAEDLIAIGDTQIKIKALGSVYVEKLPLFKRKPPRPLAGGADTYRSELTYLLTSLVTSEQPLFEDGDPGRMQSIEASIYKPNDPSKFNVFAAWAENLRSKGFSVELDFVSGKSAGYSNSDQIELRLSIPAETKIPTFTIQGASVDPSWRTNSNYAAVKLMKEIESGR